MPLIGAPAPDFTLPRDGGGTVTLSQLRSRTVVVYFYPRDDTPGCTKQAMGFSEHMPAFRAAGSTVIGISKDSVAKHDKFVAKYDLGVILASDADGDTCERYEVWKEKSMYGKTFMGIERSTFLINSDGMVLREWRKVKVPGHVEDVLLATQDA